MSNLFLKPAAGLIVRDPDSGEILPAEGRHKTDNEFWRRRLRDGDVIEVSQKQEAAPAAAQPRAPRPDTGGSLDAPHHKRADRR